MKKKLFLLVFLIILLTPLISLLNLNEKSVRAVNEIKAPKKSHWFVLQRKSAVETLYYGIPGDVNNSKIVRKFQVKTGNPQSSPTPLPKLMNKEYWLITHKENSENNPDTSPYFLRLNIPVDGNWPYGPVPYKECVDNFTEEEIQCNWEFPGYFGLHGTGGNPDKLSVDDPGSLGCVRHRDEDITYLYNLLTPETEEIRYYINDI